MAFIEWNESLSVNIPSIDRQHKVLINLINKLDDALKENRSAAVVGHVLQELVHYTVVHFIYEEGLFGVYRYPEEENHKTAHHKLAEKVLQYKSRYESGDKAIGDELMAFLKDWLTNHIMKEDMAYSDHLSKRGVK